MIEVNDGGYHLTVACASGGVGNPLKLRADLFSDIAVEAADNENVSRQFDLLVGMVEPDRSDPPGPQAGVDDPDRGTMR